MNRKQDDCEGGFRSGSNYIEIAAATNAVLAQTLQICSQAVVLSLPVARPVQSNSMPEVGHSDGAPTHQPDPPCAAVVALVAI